MKNYSVTIGQSSFIINAANLKEAKKVANFHKRMERLNGRTEVRLVKQ
mgnify:FL=1